MNRREFLKKGPPAAVGAGLVMKTAFSSGTLQENTVRIIEVKHSEVLEEERLINEDIAREMLREGMKNLTGSDNPWAQFIKPDERIGLKINALGRPILFTHHGLLKALIKELREYGVEKDNIIIWDRFEKHMEDCKFDLTRKRGKVRCYGTIASGKQSDLIDEEVYFESDFDNPDKREESGTLSYFSKIFTQHCDKIINLPVLKDHRLSGVTLCLKNLAYGVCENNSRFHGPEHIGPFIADVCALPQVREKVVLHILDGLEACYDRGPRPRQLRSLFSPRSLWFGTDPVAIDAVGLDRIDRERKYKALPSLVEDGRPVDHIALAAKKGLGVSDLERINVEKIKLG
jgi:uncharacterized protein (DUF362 family)